MIIRDDLDELRGKAFDLLIQRVCPPIKAGGFCTNCGQHYPKAKHARGLCYPCYHRWYDGREDIPVLPSARMGETVTHLNSFGVEPLTVRDWRNGRTIPLKSTLSKIMPNLVAFGIPEYMWWEAREVSVQARPGYKKRTYEYTRCRKGHELTPENVIEGTRSTCKRCRQDGRKAWLAGGACSHCGRSTAQRRRVDGLCDNCSRRKDKYGDPSAGFQSKSGYRGVKQVKNRNLLKPWIAQLRPPGGTMDYIGSYATAEEAARAYDARIRELGVDRPLNFDG